MEHNDLDKKEEDNYLNKFLIKTLNRCIKLINFLIGKLQFCGAWIILTSNVLSIGNRNPHIFIVSFPKSGTSWLQMVLYQLTTDGNLDNITHLMDEIPFLEVQHDPTNLIPAKFIKTHLPHRFFWMIRKKGKFIYIMRDGLDVAISYYHHYCNYVNYTDSFDRFYKDYFLNLKAHDGSWFKHVSYWHKEKDNPNVLFIKYEDMKKDLESVIREIIRFCEFDVKEEDMPRILERCGFEYMKQYEEKIDFAYQFNSQLLRQIKEKGNFLRKGKSGYREYYKKRHLIAYQKLFKKYVDGIGLDSYSKADEI